MCVVTLARYHCGILTSGWAREMRRRVAVTGLGIVCPLGAKLEEVWASLLAGRSAITPRTFTNAATGTTITIPAAGVPELALDPLSKVELGMTDKFGQLALMAARKAISDARINLSAENCERVGVASGTCMGGITETEVGFDTIFVRKRAKVHPFTVVRTMYNSPAAMVALSHGISGPVLAYSTTCSSSSVAIGEAARQIQHGYADVMIAGGSETLLTYSAVNCWQSAQLLAPVHDDPGQSCRPFDLTRRGTVLGEGSVFVVLEAWEHAINRRASIRAELAGYSCTNDCAHITQPSVEGQARAMQGALADAGITPGS